MNENDIREFWIESVLPGFRNAIKSKRSEELISVVVNRADRDAMSGGRFNDVYPDYHGDYKESLKELISLNKDHLSSKTLISMMCRDLHEGVTVGLIQKLVNMSMKYLYAVDIYGYASCFGIKIYVEECDCPLDSIILGKLSAKTGKSYTPWTKIASVEEYEDVQNDIRQYVKASNLEFDFKYWGT